MASSSRLDGLETGRGTNGRFRRGNPGGPGRPRRAVEDDYLRALTEECPPEAWREIVRQAVADAKAGDAKARGWLADHLIGQVRADDPRRLFEVAAAEEAGYDRVARRAGELRHVGLLDSYGGL
ncbi:MAG TPA: hypothetical protein VNG93_04995 [Candidatus Dormibacteraeota bacterium]|nr:hypothetical protein [Candidatus Dormibacteraeota bacterium]